MSIRLMSVAWEMDVPQTEKMVLLCLCDYANDQGECWPSVESLSRKCSVSDRTVQRAVRSLQSMGILKVSQSNGRIANVYAIDLSQPRHSVTPTECHPDTVSPPTPTLCRSNPDTVSPKPLRTTIEPSNKNTKRSLPDDWKPKPFGPDSKSAAIIREWPAEHHETQIEHFTAHHRAKGSRFTDWQDAWSTWVLNSRNFGRTTNGKRNYEQPSTRNAAQRALAALDAGSRQ